MMPEYGIICDMTGKIKQASSLVKIWQFIIKIDLTIGTLLWYNIEQRERKNVFPFFKLFGSLI